MKLDPAQLRADAEAHQARLESPLWSEEAEAEEEDWMAGLSVGDVGPGSPPEVHRADVELEEREWPERTPRRGKPGGRDLAREDLAGILSRLEALGRTVETLATAVAMTREELRPPTSAEGFPGWLQAAAGNPLTYDSPDPSRTSVCVRVRPELYARLQQAQARLGLRTTAGAWECLLRLGLAAAERLP